MKQTIQEVHNRDGVQKHSEHNDESGGSFGIGGIRLFMLQKDSALNSPCRLWDATLEVLNEFVTDPNPEHRTLHSTEGGRRGR